MFVIDWFTNMFVHDFSLIDLHNGSLGGTWDAGGDQRVGEALEGIGAGSGTTLKTEGSVEILVFRSSEVNVGVVVSFAKSTVVGVWI